SAGTLAFRFTDAFTGGHTAALSLHAYASGGLVSTHDLAVTAISPRQVVRDLAVIDSLGNGDGLLQVGEFVRFRIGLDTGRTSLPDVLRFTLIPLVGAAALGNGDMQLDDGHGLRSQEYLIPSSLTEPEVSLELRAANGFGAWTDTLRVPVAPGPDLTPPRVGLARARATGSAVHLVLPDGELLDGAPIAAVEARLATWPDTAARAAVPLAHEDNRYAAWWRAPGPGLYGLRVTADDEHGNRGEGAWQTLHVAAADAEPPLAPDTQVSTGAWEPVPLPGSEAVVPLKLLTFAPGHPEVIYACGGPTYGSRPEAGTWRSDDGGATWVRLGIMVSAQLQVDAAAPHTVYLAGDDPLVSRDGGITWEPLGVPGLRLLAVDPVVPGRLYAARGEPAELVVSHDAGNTWDPVGAALADTVRVHLGNPQILLLGWPTWWTPNTHEQVAGTMQRTTDGGRTWESLSLEPLLDLVYLDPHSQDGLYATARGEVWHSADGGQTWGVVGRPSFLPGMLALSIHPQIPGLLYACRMNNTSAAWRSEDGGRTWTQVEYPLYWQPEYLWADPGDPDGLYAAVRSYGDAFTLAHSSDRGLTWTAIPAPRAAALTTHVAADASGRLYVAGARLQEIEVPGDSSASQLTVTTDGYYASPDAGRSWSWHARPYGSSDVAFPTVPADFLADPSGQAVLICDSYGMWRGTDGGDTWTGVQPQGSGSYSSGSGLAVDPQQPGVVYYAQQGVSRSADYGLTWEQRSSGLPQTLSGRVAYYSALLSLVVEPGSGRPYVARYDSLWRSDDEGLSWLLAGTVGRTGWWSQALAVAPRPGGTLYLGSPDALYASPDGAVTWELRLSPDPPRTSVRSRIRTVPGDPDRVFFVHGHDVHESRDGGLTWRSLAGGLTASPVFHDVVVDPLEPEMLYAATSWGLFRRNLAEGPTAVAEVEVLPAAAILRPNYPNPFNGATAIEWVLPADGPVDLAIYDVLGRRVRSLARGPREAGAHRLTWDGRDDRGLPVGSGVYFCRLVAPGARLTRRMALAK
ncbi:MAG: FlgD immunoglobulin-like domain containing protein, partial [Gemmatimonadota bacterium]